MSYDQRIRASAGFYYLARGARGIDQGMNRALWTLDAPQRGANHLIKLFLERIFLKLEKTPSYQRKVSRMGDYVYAIPRATQWCVTVFKRINLRMPANRLSAKIVEKIEAYEKAEDLVVIEQASIWIERVAQKVSPYEPTKIARATVFVMEDIRVIVDICRDVLNIHHLIIDTIEEGPKVILQMFYEDDPEEIEPIDVFNAALRRTVAKKILPKEEAEDLLNTKKDQLIALARNSERAAFNSLFPSAFTNFVKKGLFFISSNLFKWYVYDLTGEIVSTTCEYGLEYLLGVSVNRGVILTAHKIVKWTTMTLLIRHELTIYERNREAAVEKVNENTQAYKQRIRNAITDKIVEGVGALGNVVGVVKDYINHLLTKLGRGALPPDEVEGEDPPPSPGVLARIGSWMGWT